MPSPVSAADRILRKSERDHSTEAEVQDQSPRGWLRRLRGRRVSWYLEIGRKRPSKLHSERHSEAALGSKDHQSHHDGHLMTGGQCHARPRRGRNKRVKSRKRPATRSEDVQARSFSTISARSGLPIRCAGTAGLRPPSGRKGRWSHVPRADVPRDDFPTRATRLCWKAIRRAAPVVRAMRPPSPAVLPQAPPWTDRLRGKSAASSRPDPRRLRS